MIDFMANRVRGFNYKTFFGKHFNLAFFQSPNNRCFPQINLNVEFEKEINVVLRESHDESFRPCLNSRREFFSNKNCLNKVLQLWKRNTFKMESFKTEINKLVRMKMYKI